MASRRPFVSIGGRRMYLWRAVDREGEVLDVLVQAKQDTRAALKLMRKLLKGQGFAPRALVTDKWRAYAEGDRRARYVTDKRESFPPDIEREAGNSD